MDKSDSAHRAQRIGMLIGSDARSGYVAEDGPLGTAGITDLHRLRDRALDGWLRVQMPPNYFRLEPRLALPRFGTLMNLVTDPDQNPKVLEVMAKALRGFKGRVVNPPDRVLRTGRDHVAALLQGIDGLVVPRVLRLNGRPRLAQAAMERAGFRFPAILRNIGTHSGKILGLVETAEAVLESIEPNGAFFLTEFVDTRSPDGLYRKMRVFFVGGVPIVRHLLVSDGWNIHAADRKRFMADRLELVKEERALVEGGIDILSDRTRAALAVMAERMKLDFFGADLALAPDGTLTLFEANPTMNFFPLATDPQFAYLAHARERAAAAYGRLLHPEGLPEDAAEL